MLGEGAEACSGEKLSKIGALPGPSLWPLILRPVPRNGTWIQLWPIPVAVSGTLHVPTLFPLCTHTGPYVLGTVSFCGSPLATSTCRGSRLLNGSLSWATVEGEGCFLTQDGHVVASEVQVPRGLEVLWRLSCVQSPHRTVGRVKAGREETLRSDAEQVAGPGEDRL